MVWISRLRTILERFMPQKPQIILNDIISASAGPMGGNICGMGMLEVEYSLSAPIFYVKAPKRNGDSVKNLASEYLFR